MKKCLARKRLGFFHERAEQLDTTMSAIAAKLRMKPRSLGALIWQGVLPYNKVTELAGQLNLSMDDVREEIQKASSPAASESQAAKKKGKRSGSQKDGQKNGKKLLARKFKKSPIKPATQATKEASADAGVSRLMERLRDAGVARRVTVIGLEYICLLEKAQGQPLTDGALRVLAELEGIMPKKFLTLRL